MNIIVYITCRDGKEAKEVSMHLLNKRLVACCNMFPVESMYWWKKDIQFEKEFAIIAKALKKNFNKIKAEVKKVHSYDVPCVICFEIKDGNPDFLRWIRRETEK